MPNGEKASPIIILNEQLLYDKWISLEDSFVSNQ